MACLALFYFSRYLINGTIFGEKMEYKMSVLIFSATLSETFLTLRIIQRDSITNVLRSSNEVPIVLVRF